MNIFDSCTAPCDDVCTAPCDDVCAAPVYLYFDKSAALRRVDDFMQMLREEYDYNDIADEGVSFDDYVDDVAMHRYAMYWYDEVRSDNDIDDPIDAYYGVDACFGMMHSSYDLSLCRIKAEMHCSRMHLYHGSPFLFNRFEKHINDEHHASMLETGFSTTLDYSLARDYACQSSGDGYGATRYIYNLDVTCNVVDMSSLRGAWELEPYKDLLVYLGVQAVNIDNGKETVIFDEDLMQHFTVDSIEYVPA